MNSTLQQSDSPAFQLYCILRRLGYSAQRIVKILEDVKYIPVERPIIPDVRFSLNISSADAVLKYRFDVDGILKMSFLLRIPTTIITDSSDRVLGVEAFCVVLYRLHYPKRYYDMLQIFGRSREQLCRVFNLTLNLLYSIWKDVIYCHFGIIRRRIASYCEAITRRGSPLETVWAFPDGTKFDTCRIQAKDHHKLGAKHLNLQKRIFSGHKRKHCLSFQGLTTPDGLCIHFFGPCEGSKHDVTLLRRSNLLNYFEQHSDVFINYHIYGDAAYGISKWVLSPYKGNNLPQSKLDFNKSMSAVRTSVEWNFGRMKTLWSFTTDKLQQKVMLSNVGKVILFSMFLTNCHCCHNQENQISAYFKMSPPKLEEYLNLNFDAT
jgi:hypothetical protein